MASCKCGKNHGSGVIDCQPKETIKIPQPPYMQAFYDEQMKFILRGIPFNTKPDTRNVFQKWRDKTSAKFWNKIHDISNKHGAYCDY